MAIPSKTKPSSRRPIRAHLHGWTPARRARQAEMIRRWRPWARSTGPRSVAGKARCRHNATRHGLRGAFGRELLLLLRRQRQYRLAVQKRLKAGENLLRRPAGQANMVPCPRPKPSSNPSSATIPSAANRKP